MNIKELLKKYFSGKKPRQARRDIVIVFPYNPKTKEILLIEEYRKDYDQNIWKFVSGGMDKEGKTETQVAQEELAEEMGLEAKKWSIFHEFGKVFSSVKITYFIAEDVSEMKNPPENPDDDFIVNQKWVNLNELWRMIDAKEIIWKDSVLVAVNFLRSLEK